jgi:hypothetical protein
MKTIGISGSRGFDNYEQFQTDIHYLVSNLKEDFQFCSGGARSGADHLITRYCKEYNYNLIEHLPDYTTHGKKAPILRNSLIVQDSDMMIFWWDEISRGTKDTINKCKTKGIPYRIIKI